MGQENYRSTAYHSDAARAKAQETRNMQIAEAPPSTTPAVFVVRSSPNANTYQWEIRRFGSIALDRGVLHHPNMPEARAAGELALADLLSAIEPQRL